MKVMVAIDESEYSRYAFQWALYNLRQHFSTSKLLIFTVQPVADLGYISAATYGCVHPELINFVQEQEKKVTLALLEKAEDLSASRGIKTETMTGYGDPKEAICEAVEKFNIDLLVLGSHGRGALKRAFLGSVSNYCVHNAKCPVLVVRKPA